MQSSCREDYISPGIITWDTELFSLSHLTHLDPASRRFLFEALITLTFRP